MTQPAEERSAAEIEADNDRIRRHCGETADAPLTAREFLTTWTCQESLPWDSTDFMLIFAEDFAAKVRRELIEAREERPQGFNTFKEWREQWNMRCEVSVKDTCRIIELEQELSQVRQALTELVSYAKQLELLVYPTYAFGTEHKTIERAEALAKVQP